jgi:hypothetical protein
MNLRLVDPLGYDAVTEGYRVQVSPDQAAHEIARLETEVAARHAGEHAYANYRPSQYTVRIETEDAC